MSTAYVLQLSGLWFCFQPLHAHPTHHTSTLRHSGIVFQLPTIVSFAHLSKLSGDTLLISGYCTFSPMHIPDSFNLDPMRLVSPQDPFLLIQSI